MYADRDEFIKKFREEHPNYLNNENDRTKSSRNGSSKKFKKRYDYLYNLDKEQRSKIEEKQKQKAIEEDQKEMIGCTFTPQISTRIKIKYNDKLKLNKVNNNTEQSKNTHTINDSLVARQEYWNNKKRSKLDSIIKLEEKKMLSECLFSPIIRSDDEIKWEIFQGRAENLVADPESYEQYIKRIKEKRERDQKEKQMELNKPGYGNIWKNKHLLPKSYSKKTFKTIENKHVRHQSYTNRKQLTDNNIRTNKDDVIDYQSAIKCLHQQLNSIKLLE